MAIDEIKALEIALATSRAQGREWRSPFAIWEENGAWEVESEPRQRVRIDQSGELIAEPVSLAPVAAFSLAREYAVAHSLGWKPTFTLRLEAEHWEVGSCQSQWGGNVQIYVSHGGVVIRHHLNPK